MDLWNNGSSQRNYKAEIHTKGSSTAINSAV